MAKRLHTVGEAEARQRQAWQRWKAQARPVDLVCHVYGHLFPDPYADDIEARRGKRGTIQWIAPCVREIDGERCGTRITKVLGEGGVLEYSRNRTYDHEERYLIPPEALQFGFLSKSMRGELRLFMADQAAERRAERAKAEAKARRAGARRARKPAASGTGKVAG